MSRIANTHLDLDTLRRESVRYLKTTFQTVYADIVLDDSLISPQLPIRIPMIHENRCIAYVVLGEKRSGDPYTPEDRQLLTTFSQYAAVALEKARLYREATQYSAALEEKVHERTKELNRLYESQSKLLLDMSHELQTPLAILKGHMSQAKLDAADATINRMSHLITNLLALARGDFGQEPRVEGEVSLTALIEELSEDIAVLAEYKGITLHADISPTAAIRGDRRRLKELFLNLSSNALKYTAPGGSITFTVLQYGSYARVQIRDTGCGIAREHHAHIFNRFYRSASMTGYEGAGLGLAIAKQIVEQHGGTIRVDSEVGQGSMFEVEFPCRA